MRHLALSFVLLAACSQGMDYETAVDECLKQQYIYEHCGPSDDDPNAKVTDACIKSSEQQATRVTAAVSEKCRKPQPPWRPGDHLEPL